MTSSLGALSGATGVPTSTSAIFTAAGLPTTTQGLVGQLPTTTQGQIAQATQLYGAGMQIAGQAAPAISLAGTIASGKVPSEQEIVGGMAAVATLTMGPVAGAVVGVAGEAALALQSGAQSLFNALGLYDHPLDYNYGVGFIRANGVDTIPYGSADPLWIHLTPESALDTFMSKGDAHHPAPAGNYNFEMVGLLGAAYAQQDTTPVAGGRYNANAFDKYFSALLAKDIEYWANAQPYIPVRTLLSGAAQAWNLSHSSSKTVTYPPTPGKSGILEPVVSQILGPVGVYATQGTTAGANNEPPLTINLGPAIAVPVPPKPAALATPQKVITLKLRPQAAPTPVVIEPWYERVLPALPAAVGSGLYPWLGLVAPGVGTGISLLWYALKEWG